MSLEAIAKTLREAEAKALKPYCPACNREMVYIYLGSGKFEWMCDGCLRQGNNMRINVVQSLSTGYMESAYFHIPIEHYRLLRRAKWIDVGSF